MLVKKIEECVYVIDNLTECISQDRLEEARELLLSLNKQLQIVIPPIAASYLREELKEVQEDMQYWIQQLERIMKAMEGNDLFLLVDVLRYETKENMNLYCNMIRQAGMEEIL